MFSKSSKALKKVCFSGVAVPSITSEKKRIYDSQICHSSSHTNESRPDSLTCLNHLSGWRRETGLFNIRPELLTLTVCDATLGTIQNSVHTKALNCVRLWSEGVSSGGALSLCCHWRFSERGLHQIRLLSQPCSSQGGVTLERRNNQLKQLSRLRHTSLLLQNAYDTT